MSALATPEIATTTWKIDPVHSVAEFKVKHMMITNVKGQFTGVSGSLSLDENDLTLSHVEATIDAASINTREPQRDTHLKSPDFFDVEKFPTLSFKSTHVSRNADGGLTVAGDLTIHGVTRNQRDLRRRRSNCSGQRSMGQHAPRLVGNDEDQPQRFRPNLERRARDRRYSGRRRSDHHPRG